METKNQKTKLTFDQMPEAVAYLVDEVARIKELVRIQVHAQPEKRLPISIQKASKIVGLAIQTIYGLVSAKQIPYYKKGKFLYFYEDELLNWIQSGKNGGNPSPQQ